MKLLPSPIKPLTRLPTPLVCCVILLLVFIIFGLVGIDFGKHWDEPKLLRSVENAYLSQRFLPGWYQYPSFTFWVGLLSKYLTVGVHALSGVEVSLTIMWRSIMITITGLSGLWTYLLALRISHRQSVALIAPALLMLSPELLYHSRWIAPDALMMQLGIASTLVLHLSFNHTRHSFQRLLQASVLAGLACSTKYPGGLFIVPIILISPMLLTKHHTWATRLIRCTAPIGLFTFTVLLTTPGILLETGQFLADVNSEINHYRRGHATYGVTPGLSHLWLNLRYLLLCLSDVIWVQILLSISIISGYIQIARSDKKTIITVLIVPSIYLLYFSTQRVMIVRNLLVLLPFMVILGAMGLQTIAQKLPVNKRIWALAGLTFALMQTQTNFLSARSINRTADVRTDLASFVLNNPHLEIRPSTKLSTDPLVEVLSDSPKSDIHRIMVVFWSDERRQIPWVTNHAQRYIIISGQHDVNWSYYPSWLGGRRLLAVSLSDAVKMGLVKQVPQSASPPQ